MLEFDAVELYVALKKIGVTMKVNGGALCYSCKKDVVNEYLLQMMTDRREEIAMLAVINDTKKPPIRLTGPES